jgi:asparagine synthase (glutamine-hydrolysing)
MCGITGVICFNDTETAKLKLIDAATVSLYKRGPDSSGIYSHNFAAFGHSRLSIIDVSALGAQPMKDESGRFVIVFNGEIYNYKELKNELLQKGYSFKSDSDTEVLLNLFIEYKEKCLDKLNGFFAFAVYDSMEETLFIARDRIGIKPLLFYKDEKALIFASELKAILAYGINKELNAAALYAYLQLNYIPAPATILNNVFKLLPGHYIKTDSKGNFITEKYFQIETPVNENSSSSIPDYDNAVNQLRSLLDDSVQKRLIADVPLGTFLSGGIDSSVISFLASRHSPHINTFSIGFRDEPFFDETKYADLVSKKIKTNHTVFSLSNNDLFENLFDILDYLDEPFADSSAIAVYILCKETKKKVTVALSGDGADELFGGYNKHAAEYKARNSGFINILIKSASPVLRALPKSRNSKTSNFFRQLSRYAEGMQLGNAERYWRWCGFANEDDASKLLSESNRKKLNLSEYNNLKTGFTGLINQSGSLNDMLYADMHLVLPNDMLQKVDLMSMANSLEVRVPFLDHRVVNFAFSLPFKNDLPEEIFTRPKHGFEVPLLKWFRNELHQLIFNDLLDDEFVSTQNIFDVNEIRKIKQQLLSDNPGDAQARIWGLLVFQYWWKKYFS